MKKLIDKVIFYLTAAVLTTVLSVGCASTSTSKSNQNSKNKSGTPLVMDSMIKQGCFDNGMSYFVLPNKEPTNRIELRLVVRAGSCMEEDDQKGVAHFIEHLAFNGTENFEKSAIVDYFETIGMNFGADLNAYTSFEETVYMLQVPADDPEMLKTALLILHDWACGITFPQEEIDKERGVITEEWRLGQGLQGRTRDVQIPFMLSDSQFEKRLPIGDMDIIANISRERILDFYKKWYRPEFMSVIVVGDAETESMEKAVVEAMGSIPSSDKSVTLPRYSVPYSSEKEILLFQDPEQQYTVVNVLEQIQDYSPRTTEEEIKINLTKQICKDIFAQRLNEITNTPDAVWLGAGLDTFNYTDFTYFNYIGFIPKENSFIDSMKVFMDEAARIRIHGVNESEFKRIRDYYVSAVEQDYVNKDKLNSGDLAAELVNYVTTGKTVVSEEDFHSIAITALSEITINDINETIAKAYPENGTKMVIVAPKSVNDIPSKEEIMEIWENYESGEISAYEDDIDGDELMNRPKKKAKVVSENEIPELAAKEFILSNGFRIVTKKTEFEKNVIKMCVTSTGGLNLIEDSAIPSAKACINYAIYSGIGENNYNQLIKKLTSKQVGINLSIEPTEEKIDGSCTGEDLESLLQLLYLFFMEPRFEDDAWSTYIQGVSETAKTHGVQPIEALNDKIFEIVYGNSIRYAPTDLDYVSKMNQKVAEQVYKERFGNPDDFTYCFVGDFDEEKLIDLCCYYLGNLKVTGNKEQEKYVYYGFPKGKTVETVKKGLDDQGIVYICFGGKLPKSSDIEENYCDRQMLSQLSSLLDIRLREVIREDKGGSYGINVNYILEGNTERNYLLDISFGCEPSREEELAAEVIEQIKKVKSELVSSDYITKLQETYRRNFESSSMDNGWWMYKICSEFVYANQPLWTSQNPEKVITMITSENLKAYANKYLDTDNYVTVFLKPER